MTIGYVHDIFPVGKELVSRNRVSMGLHEHNRLVSNCEAAKEQSRGSRE